MRRRHALALFAVLSIVTLCAVAAWLRRDSTIYAPGYSWGKFSTIRIGMTTEEVTRILGPPLRVELVAGEIHWDVDASERARPGDGGDPKPPPASVRVSLVADLSGKILRAHHAGTSPAAGGLVGRSLDEVRRRHGRPLMEYTIPRQTMYWSSQLRNIKGEYVMLIHFDATGKVDQVDADRIGHYVATPGRLPRPHGLLEWLEWYVF